MSDRTKRLSRLGNAVVPQVAEWIGRRILDFYRTLAPTAELARLAASDLDAVLAEQRAVRDHFAAHPGDRGAILGLADLVGEELLMRTEES